MRKVTIQLPAVKLRRLKTLARQRHIDVRCLIEGMTLLTLAEIDTSTGCRPRTVNVARQIQRSVRLLRKNAGRT